MRMLVSAPMFAKAVSHVSKALTAGSRQAVRLAVEGNRLCLDGDGAYYSRAVLDVESFESGVAVVNGFWLAAAANAMPMMEVSVETMGDRLRLDCRGIVMELPLLADPSMTPVVPRLPDVWVECENDGFARAVQAVAHAAQRNGDRPVLQAVRVHGLSDGVELSATNRFVAASARVAGVADMDVLVSAQWLKANADSTTRFGASDRLFAVMGPVFLDAVALMDGRPPDLSRVWPSRGSQLTLTMGRTDLLDAAKRVRAAKFSPGETVALSLRVGEDSMTVGLVDGESGSGARQTIPVRVDGSVEDTGRPLRLDARYVANACNALCGERIRMHVSVQAGRYKPVLLTDVSDETEEPSFDMRDEQLITPIM